MVRLLYVRDGLCHSAIIKRNCYNMHLISEEWKFKRNGKLSTHCYSINICPVLEKFRKLFRKIGNVNNILSEKQFGLGKDKPTLDTTFDRI